MERVQDMDSKQHFMQDARIVYEQLMPLARPFAQEWYKVRHSPQSLSFRTTSAIGGPPCRSFIPAGLANTSRNLCPTYIHIYLRQTFFVCIASRTLISCRHLNVQVELIPRYTIIQHGCSSRASYGCRSQNAKQLQRTIRGQHNEGW